MTFTNPELLTIYGALFADKLETIKFGESVQSIARTFKLDTEPASIQANTLTQERVTMLETLLTKLREHLKTLDLTSVSLP